MKSVLAWLRGLSAAAAVVVLLALGATAALFYWYFSSREAPEPPSPAGELALPRGTRSVTLFFASAAGDSLVSEQRQVLESDRVTETVRTLVDELVRGPAAGGRPVFPAGVTARHVFLDESGNLYIDFSPELVRRFRGGSTAEYLLLASLVRTLSRELPTVEGVTITVNGQPVSTLGGHFSLEGPLATSEWR
ncbi:MAG TPA: GerMN domain-containing protein [Candidatus Eisenbacteria bacterium]|jgi:spore germination protein GerM|nr:GerMN domain-containing protein [Candidatus Eisenbacteria bacterium]